MPSFGVFETIGDPISVTEESGRISTIWEARNTAASDGRRYAVKCLTLRRSEGATGRAGDEALEADVGLEFLEAVKQLKRAHAAGGRCLAPICEFGTCEEGVWYAADYRPRQSLKEWINLRGGVDHAALRNVAASLVAGCLALQRSGDRSHGNLKPGNVLLARPRGLLRATPLELVDPRAASLLSESRLDPSDQQTLEDLRKDASELHDLQAIGEIILQLVRGDLFRRKDEYDYPVRPSARWEKLGKQGEYWLGVCNRLLNPQLSLGQDKSLGQEKLTELEKEFGLPGSGGAPNTRLIAAGAVTASLVVVFACWLLVPRSHVDPAKLKQMQDAIAVGKTFLDQTNFSAALLRFQDATRFAEGINDQKNQRLSKDFQHLANLLDQATSLRGDTNKVDDEIERLNQGLEEAQKLKEQQLAGTIESWLAGARNRRGTVVRAQFRSVMESGNQSLQEGHCEQASQYFADAISLAKKLGDPAVEKEATYATNYSAAWCGALAAENDLKFHDAVEQWKKAEAARPGDSLSPKRRTIAETNNDFQNLLTSIDTSLKATNREYQILTELFDKADKAANGGQIDHRLLQAETNLKIEWTDIRNQDQRSVQDLLGSAMNFLVRGEYKNARSSFDRILAKEPGNQEAASGTNFIDFMETARGLMARADYANAATTYTKALALRRTDPWPAAEFAVCTNMSLGERSLARGDLGAAGQAFEQARARDEGDQGVTNATYFVRLLLNGDSDYRSGKFTNAASEYDAAMDIEHYRPWAANRAEMARCRVKGESFLAEGKYGTGTLTNLQTAANLEAQLKLQPTDGKGATNSAADGVIFAGLAAKADSALESDQADYPSALDLCNQALKFRPSDSLVKKMQAKAESGVKQTIGKAAAVALNSGLSNLISLYFGQASSNYSSAIALLASSPDQSKKQEANNGKILAQALLGAGELLNKGDFASAYDSAYRAIGIWPAHDDIAKRQVVRVAIAAANGRQSTNLDVSLAWVNKALTLDPTNAEALGLSTNFARAISRDYSDASTALDQCNLTNAERICSAHAQNTNFTSLARRIQSVSDDLKAAQANLADGKYQELFKTTNSYSTNQCFVELYRKGAEEDLKLASLTNLMSTQIPTVKASFCSPEDFKGLRENYSRWYQIKSNYDALPAETRNKGPFQQLVGPWITLNDPVKQLDDRLQIFKIWFLKEKNTNNVADPFTGKPAALQPSGIPVPSYVAILKALEDEYSNMKRLGPVQKVFDELDRKIRLWNG